MADTLPRVADNSELQVDRQALLTVLTTEHFTLQGARGSTISESSARAALYVGALSSALVALGFIGQGGQRSSVFDVFALVVLPTVFVLGIFTFNRLVASSIEDLLYARAINRIRQYYLHIAGSESRYIVLGAHDDPVGALANMGIARPSRWQLYFTIATVVAFLNAVVGGASVAFALAVAGIPLVACVLAGSGAGGMSLWAHLRWQQREHDQGKHHGETFQPSAAT
jgi:hypothetical protein